MTNNNDEKPDDTDYTDDERLADLVTKLNATPSEREFFERYIKSTEDRMEHLEKVVKMLREGFIQYADLVMEMQEKQLEMSARLFSLEHSRR
jgi:hypothetical protein